MVNFSDFESSVDNAYALLPVEDLKAIITLIKNIIKITVNIFGEAIYSLTISEFLQKLSRGLR